MLRPLTSALIPLAQQGVKSTIPRRTIPYALQAIQRAACSRLSDPGLAQRHNFSTLAKVAKPLAPSIESLNNLIAKEFPTHPFSTYITQENVKGVLRHYLAMSLAFPYLQAGAYKDIILDLIHSNLPIPQGIEKTFVVGAFLSFDETGGNWVLRTKGIKALPQLLKTEKNFHASLLKQDLCTLFGEPLLPDYQGATAIYLKNLLSDLGSTSSPRRMAAMVAFEMHAGRMIEALWTRLQEMHPSMDKDALEYFRIHVGGDDPQEEYHKQLTCDMMNSLLSPSEVDKFYDLFRECYTLNFNWCQQITRN